MLKICLVFWKSEPRYAYKRYAYKKKHVYQNEDNFEICTFKIAKITNLERQLGQSINLHS